MAYGTKYIIQYYDRLGLQTVINIKKNSYSGATTYLDATDTPLIINYPEPDERFSPIRGSEARIQFYSESPYTYLPLFTSGNREYYIDITKDGSDYWHGYLYPSVYQQQLSGGPYVVEITAWDGLGRLDNYTFENYLGWPVFEDNSLLTVIRTCLEFTGLDKSLRVSTGLTSDGSAGEFLNNTYVNTLAFVKDGEWMNAKEVLTEVLTAINCRIYQAGQLFYIIGFNEYGGTITTQNYNAAGVFTGTGTITTKTITAANPSLGTSILCYLEGLQLSVELPVKDVAIINTFGQRENILQGDFSKPFWSGETTLQFWDNPSSLNISQAEDAESVFIGGTINRNTTTPKYLSQDLTFKIGSEKAAFKITFDANADSAIANGANIEIIVKHKASAFSGYQYLQDDGSWSSTANAKNFIIPINIWKAFEWEADLLNMYNNTGNTFTIQVSQLFGFGSTPSATDGVYIKNISIENLTPIEKVEKLVERDVDENGEESKDFEILIGTPEVSRPDLPYAAPGTLRTSAGNLLTSYTHDLGTFSDLSNYLSIVYDLNFSQPREILSGQIYGYLTLNHAITDSAHLMNYLIMSQSIDDINCVNEVQLYEIPNTAIIDGGVISEYNFPYTLPALLSGTIPEGLPYTLPFLAD